MAQQTTTALKDVSLRHRSHPLSEKTHTTHKITLASGSVTSSDSIKDLSFASEFDVKTPEKERRRRPVLVEDESTSNGSDDEVVVVNGERGLDERDVSDTQNSTHWNQADAPAPQHDHPSRAWYEFDLAVVVALVSPIGNWLTGGDYIKNLVLMILLVFYLHQIIEVPWELYHKSRPRRRAGLTRNPSSSEDHYKHVATSELRVLEFFFLALTALSPFVGAVFLRYATAAIIGDQAVSWFNTSLFVLATGMRPWSHLVQRLKQRTTDLHDVIHYPSPDLSAQDLRAQMADLMNRVEHLERSLSKAKARLVDATEQVYDYVDEAVTVVDHTVKHHERKCEKQEARVQELEQALEGLKSKGKQRASATGLSIRTTPNHQSFLARLISRWIYPVQHSHRSIYSPSSHSPSASKSLRSFPSTSSVQLQSIPEEESMSYPIWARPANFTAFVLSRVGYVVTLPFRAIIRMVLRRY
ncbi:hypothetical protein H0H92_007839 [Tricholoma furcatifolium]|nr:hypothetical protein H0H92_007839 [Tricholoma furcatifolium]